jgi:hypothetical protein
MYLRGLGFNHTFRTGAKRNGQAFEPGRSGDAISGGTSPSLWHGSAFIIPADSSLLNGVWLDVLRTLKAYT